MSENKALCPAASSWPCVRRRELLFLNALCSQVHLADLALQLEGGGNRQGLSAAQRQHVLDAAALMQRMKKENFGDAEVLCRPFGRSAVLQAEAISYALKQMDLVASLGRSSREGAGLHVMSMFRSSFGSIRRGDVHVARALWAEGHGGRQQEAAAAGEVEHGAVPTQDVAHGLEPARNKQARHGERVLQLETVARLPDWSPEVYGPDEFGLLSRQARTGEGSTSGCHLQELSA